MPDKNCEHNIPTYSDGKKGLYWFWWLIGACVQIAVCLPWVYKKIQWRALGLTTLVFCLMMFISENIAVYYGWWVWNEKKLLGPKVILVPLEEFLLYFVVPLSLVAIQGIVMRLRRPEEEK